MNGIPCPGSKILYLMTTYPRVGILLLPPPLQLLERTSEEGMIRC